MKALLNVGEAAEFLGISKRTVLRLWEVGALSVVRIGRRRMFHVDALRAFAEKGLRNIPLKSK